MPRKGRRSEAARLRWSRLNQEEPRPSSPPPQAVQTVSPQVEESRKGPIPARRSRTMDTPSPGSRSPVSNFVLIVGDSHLRALVDGLVDMPEGCLSFGFMSTPGASASQLQTEVQHAVLPWIPEAVCLLAPSNNLTASRTVDEAAIDFAKLLTTVRNRWPKVLDFPPRLNVEVSYQDFLRQEFHRVAARMGVKYSSVAEHFPLTRLELWSRKDGVHLSDHEGMGILTQLLWSAAMHQLETPPPAPQVSPRPSQPLRKFSPKLVVVGDVLAPRSPDPFQQRTARQGSKVSQPGKPSQSQQQEKECSFPLNPVWFSSATLRAMEEVSPSTLSHPVDCQPSPKPKRVASSAPAKHPRIPRSNGSSVNNVSGWITPSQVVLEISNAETPCSPPVAKMVICFVFNGAGGFRNASPASQGPPQQPVFSEQQLQALKVNPDLDSCPLRTPAVSGAMGGYDEPDQHVKEEKEEYGDVMLPASLPHVTSLPPPAFKSSTHTMQTRQQASKTDTFNEHSGLEQPGHIGVQPDASESHLCNSILAGMLPELQDIVIRTYVGGSVLEDAAEAEAVDAGEEEADEEVSTDKPLKIPTPVTGVAKLDTGLENVP
ncbi:hypothetical protein D5F01_LYC05660 [Larimichthys crocea]|uniref:Uncharacterized protein n=1 Tax=Larimichthys crocea TaxID=215358 RepID=A0A6G0J070_LARCR|nr:hypothetical protein D5F01_LYC05660 [Larimichthys crocea]